MLHLCLKAQASTYLLCPIKHLLIEMTRPLLLEKVEVMSIRSSNYTPPPHPNLKPRSALSLEKEP